MQTSYVYDNYGRLKSVSKSNLSNEYIYSEGRLDDIRVGNQDKITYDSFGKVISVSVGEYDAN